VSGDRVAVLVVAVFLEEQPSSVADLSLAPHPGPLEADGGDESSGGLIVTAMRPLNAIPAVCAAPPGVLSALDLPLVTGRGLMR
jgi:hypothetical protein